MLRSRIYLGLARISGFLSLAAVMPLVCSQDTLTDRVAVNAVVFNQKPESFALVAAGRRIELIRSHSELKRLSAFARKRGFSGREPGESSLDFAQRAARFVQDLIPHGRESKNHFRWWGFERIMKDVENGQRFWCGTYARLLTVLALSEDIPARSVWMKGHVTSEIYASKLGKWVEVDAMYNHILHYDDRKLSATEIHALVERGRRPNVDSISSAPGLDEPAKPIFSDTVANVYGGGIFKVFDGDINFSSDRAHLILPAMSLTTDALPRGTFFMTRLLRLLVPLLFFAALTSTAFFLRYRWVEVSGHRGHFEAA
jgi:hypothetical protein